MDVAETKHRKRMPIDFSQLFQNDCRGEDLDDFVANVQYICLRTVKQAKDSFYRRYNRHSILYFGRHGMPGPEPESWNPWNNFKIKRKFSILN